MKLLNLRPFCLLSICCVVPRRNCQYLPSFDIHPLSGMLSSNVMGSEVSWFPPMCLSISCWLITTIETNAALAIVKSSTNFQLRFDSALLLKCAGRTGIIWPELVSSITWGQQSHLAGTWTRTEPSGGRSGGSRVIVSSSGMSRERSLSSFFWKYDLLKCEYIRHNTSNLSFSALY